MSISITEAEIQNRLYTWLNEKGHILSVPNLCLGPEADMISVTKKNLVHEYEIKTWRGDFLRELSSIKFAMDGGWSGHTHRMTMDQLSNDSESYAESIRRAKRVSVSKVHKHSNYMKVSECGKVSKRSIFVPNYYWIVALTGVIKDEDLADIPDWVGIIEAKREGKPVFVTKRNAKMMHDEKVSPGKLTRIVRGVYYRYWSTRLKSRVGAK